DVVNRWVARVGGDVEGGAIWSGELDSGGELVSAEPVVVASVPEQVVFGGDHHAGAVAVVAVGVDGDLNQIGVTLPGEGGCDDLGCGLAGLGSVARTLSPGLISSIGFVYRWRV